MLLLPGSIRTWRNWFTHAEPRMRNRFPSANELIYDNYNFLVIGYGPTERPSDCIVSLAANSKGVNLNFLWGSKLPDPHKILQGAGGHNPLLRLPQAATLSKTEVKQLLALAESQAVPPFPQIGFEKAHHSIHRKQTTPKKIKDHHGRGASAEVSAVRAPPLGRHSAAPGV
jgi:hypothetical protein